ncbi:GNAT family N-acetyltransferase [Streptomyces sp. KMM 9044]|uniref:GNAT family N-acetyltransferase n=1 Tax=Streptomyces sp. KMM 9044 TaxID=2744474 RepID=UPI002151A0D5|nr:GNAT family N-acetyltransferase [Streptomyces sp. KMM 9044]WAX76548.1 GNAT family N-acetyltransferase [Streptomyces sp. KMM 9044]
MIDGFGTVRMRVVDPRADVDVLHSWVTQERARYWGMLGTDRERVREIYEYVDSLATHHAYLVHLNDRPVALFQTYEPEHDPVAECYEVQPGDFGIHVLIGPPAGPVTPGFTGALLGSFLTHLLEDRSRTRIVAEPDARNDRAIARFLRAGFVKGPEIELPGKRAQLVFLNRLDFRRA